jgi:hypothetical protein
VEPNIHLLSYGRDTYSTKLHVECKWESKWMSVICFLIDIKAFGY